MIIVGEKHNTIRCRDCSSLLIYTENDITEGVLTDIDGINTYWRGIVCPKCKERILIKKKRECTIELDGFTLDYKPTKRFEARECPHCIGGIMHENTSIALTSNPPKYEWVCDVCGHREYKEF